MHRLPLRGLRYDNVDRAAVQNNAYRDTGASRYFNFLDHDGTATWRPKPSMMLSYPGWWQVGPDCSYEVRRAVTGHRGLGVGCRGAALRMKAWRRLPCVIFSYPEWWQVGPDCSYEVRHVNWVQGFGRGVWAARVLRYHCE